MSASILTVQAAQHPDVMLNTLSNVLMGSVCRPIVSAEDSFKRPTRAVVKTLMLVSSVEMVDVCLPKSCVPLSDHVVLDTIDVAMETAKS